MVSGSDIDTAALTVPRKFKLIDKGGKREMRAGAVSMRAGDCA
jgi:hypothetical protein